jgi:UDP-N-acetylmuramoyl-tripeptide--D-alanyl-D-alanine ligase
MKLAETDILKIRHLRTLGLGGNSNIPITGVSTDSRSTQPGNIFFAIRGEKFDGHDFVTRAISSGAAVVVVDQKWADSNAAMLVSVSIPRLVVENTVTALGDLASRYREKFDIPVIAVAGSNGKTTTKNMMAAVLGTKYNVLSTEGNLNNHLGVPQTLFKLEQKHDMAVVEIGTNHFGELEYLCRILAPTHGVITNIGREHLEFFENVEGVAKAEGELFEWLRLNKGTMFVNKDDAHIVRQSKRAKADKAFSYGFRTAGLAVRGKVLGLNREGCAQLRVKPLGKKVFDVQLNVPGEQNARNALCAAAIALKFGVSATNIKKALESFSATGKRMEVLRLDGITVLNDTYNANPDSVLAALSTLRKMKTKGRRIAVLGDMLELGTTAVREHRNVGKAVATNRVDCLYTFGPLSKSIHDAAAIKMKTHFDDKGTLSQQLSAVVSEGDVVLVKGSRGMKMEEVVTVLQEKFR